MLVNMPTVTRAIIEILFKAYCMAGSSSPREQGRWSQVGSDILVRDTFR